MPTQPHPARDSRFCSVHMNEPCPSGRCHAKCDARWHRRRAVTDDPELGPLCAECAREGAQDRAFERRDRTAYSRACGYES